MLRLFIIRMNPEEKSKIDSNSTTWNQDKPA